MTMSGVFGDIDAGLDRALDELIAYCRLPTVSAHGTAIEETARATIALLEAEGFETRLLPKPAGGNPVIYAEQQGRSPKTLLFYNHYDVQPPDPLDEWTSPPFEPALRDGKLFGRGISDDKGNIVSRMLAVRALKQQLGALPCNVKFFIEGDEEIGSPQIAPFMHQYGSMFAADACVWEWGYTLWDGSPTLMLGAKGLLCVDIEVQGPNRDVHSSFGTVVPNPAWRLAWALGSIKDPQENILIDGFYDGVPAPTEEELVALRLLPDEGREFLDSLGLHEAVLGVKDADYRRRHIFEPTCTINGLTSGYQGQGTKTVLPARASAKLDFRLVGDQDPDDIIAKLRRHLERYGFDDVVVKQSSSERAARTQMDDPFIDVAQAAARDVYGREAFLVPSMAATGPMYHFVHDLGLATVMAGINYVGGRDHAPDEHVRIEDFRRGTKHIAAILQRFAEA
ncbi:MAG TPA: M20/M25/M40 family metallo-hydrolase [Dehalococcoidia bacterium]|nr:M20/M25/M40 family metallo-hydrolase [Dehalococcoidia bacterium]